MEQKVSHRIFLWCLRFLGKLLLYLLLIFFSFIEVISRHINLFLKQRLNIGIKEQAPRQSVQSTYGGIF